MRRVLVTGAGGFVGRHLCAEIVRRGLSARAASRRPDMLSGQIESAAIGQIDARTDWAAALAGVDTVIHLAARAHLLRDQANDPLAEFRRVNVDGTERLAYSAFASGVTRLVYVSSIGVNGSQTVVGKPFSELDALNPHNAYALSKLEAEQALRRISAETGLEVVIVRPPLVYGRNAPGNFAQMLKVLKCGIPLPLASAHNWRSLIYVGNLVDALILCAVAPEARGETYLVCDGEDVSTPELLRRLGAAIGRPARLLPCPVALLRMAGRLTGKADQIDRLFGSLQINDAKIRRELGWVPPYTLEQGLHATAEWYRDQYPC